MDNPEPRAQYLNVVLRQIDRTALRIPRFQRAFVWGERDVLELLGSIEKGYPIGSILTWKVDGAEEYFSGYREVPFPPANDSPSGFEVILDGAQRLSSLYGCLRNVEAGEIYHVLYDLRACEFVHAANVPSRGSWHVPMSALFDSRRFLAVQSAIADLEDGDDLLPRALDLYSTFQDYQIPIIALSNAPLEDVVEVFRRVNSSGTPLSPVDFVRALTWQSSFDLEETFEDLASRYQGTPLEGFTEDFLIRSLAITAGLSLDSRDVVQLKSLSDRQGGLDSEIVAMRATLDRLAELLMPLNIRAMKEVPYEVQRLLLFALVHYELPVSGDEVRSWFWRSTFAEEHQSKPESYTTRLINAMRGGDIAPALEIRKPIDPGLFAERIRRGGSAVTIGFNLLLRNRNSRSLISGDLVDESTGLYGHLFDRAELTEGDAFDVPSARVLANLVLLSPTDAAAWRALQPGVGLNAMYEVCEARTGCAEEIWRSQGLIAPFDEISPRELLRQRSIELLESVVGDGHATERSVEGA